MTEFEAKTGHTFENYYKDYHPKLTRFLTILSKDSEEAHDVATEAFMVGLDRIDSYDPSLSAYSTWLFTIAKRIMIQKLRIKNRFSSIDNVTDDGLCIADTLMQSIEDTEEVKKISDKKAVIVNTLIPKLPKKYADVLTLRHVKDYSYQDISDELNVNLNTIKSRIRQARLLICRLVKDDFDYIDTLDTLDQLNDNILKTSHKMTYRRKRKTKQCV
jgi:RNA polymerase sigma-70 factor (ECF subfamily)